MIIGYYRISPKGSNKEGESVANENQREDIAKYCEAIGLDKPVFVGDLAKSGRKDSRPGWVELKELLRSGCIKAVVTTAEDRLFRDVEQAEVFRKLCIRYATELHVVGKGKGKVNLKDRSQVLAYVLLAAVAQDYSFVISEKVTRWVQRRREQGRKTGGNVPYGFKADDKGRLSEDLDEQRAIDLMLQLRSKGYGLQAICRELQAAGVPTKTGRKWWATTTVNKIIRGARARKATA